ncbi:MAG: sigma-70 family RNA polymerase sigma factor [Polyangiaceae bacterium]|nr:sigma-70 family RNA polymerase sigma factor [Polyangiaceae bacterium]
MSVSTKTSDSPEVLARIKEGLVLVNVLARQIRSRIGPYVRLEDLVSGGREALLAAARSYDPDKGLPFHRWAIIRVRGSMIDSIRSNGLLPRRIFRKVRAMQAAQEIQDAAAEERTFSPAMTAEEADAKLSDQLDSAALATALSFLAMSSDELGKAPDTAPDPEEQAARAELIAKIRAAIAEQPETERRLLDRHYFDGLNLDEAARELGLSKSWGSRLHARAIESVARAMKRDRVSL